MSTEDLDSILQPISAEIKKGRAVLFLGAGASMPAGGPSTAELVQLLKDNFHRCSNSSDDLLDLCQEIVDTPGYDLQQLEEVVTKRLATCKATDEHKLIPNYPWSTIFTTNYDDLVEQAYNNMNMTLHPVFQDEFSVNPFDKSRVFLFKLLGSITAPQQKNGKMVLTRSQYNALPRRRKKFLDLLSDSAKDGALVFVGYSGKDRIVFDIMERLIEEYGELVSWSYILLPHKVDDERENYRFLKNRMKPIVCTFEQFFQWLKINYDSSAEPRLKGTMNLRIEDQLLEVDKQKLVPYASTLEILNEENMKEDPGNKDDFFKDINKSWGAFAAGWDFKRSAYDTPVASGSQESKKSLKTRVLEELLDEQKRGSENNRLLIITGMPGVGKTVMLRRLAFDAAENGVPTIISHSTESGFDFRLLDGVMMDIESLRSKKLPESKPPKFLIIIDDAPALPSSPLSLLNYLISRGREVLVVAAGRTNEWLMLPTDILGKVGKENVINVPENMDEKEKIRFKEYVNRQGYAPSGEVSTFIMNRNYEGSFFAAMYSLIYPTRPPLNQAIQDQFMALPKLPQAVLKFVCCFSQFNLSTPLNLLVRALKNDFVSLQGMLDKELKDIVFSYEDDTGNILARTHHRIIATKTIEFFLPDPKQQKETFEHLLSDVHFGNEQERRVVENLLIFYLGPNSNMSDLTYEHKHDLFELVCKQEPTRSLLHHWGILEKDKGNYPAAESLLRKALSAGEEYFGQESEQNILTSLGGLYAKMERSSRQGDDIGEADRYFGLASKCLSRARFGSRPNSHAFHSEALMYKIRGDETKDQEKKFRLYSDALYLVNMALASISELDEVRDQIERLRTEVLFALGRTASLEKIAEQVAEKYGTPIVFVAYATLLRRQGKRRDLDESRKITSLRRAIDIVDKVLVQFPTDAPSLQLKAVLMRDLKLKYKEPTAYFETMKKWRECVEIPSLLDLYELAVTAFMLGYYKTAYIAFEDLDKLSLGHPLRTVPSRVFRETYPPFRPKIFTGTVQSVQSSKEGRIKCHELTNLKETIHFAPLGSRGPIPKTGDIVSFIIAFSFIAPRAAEVRRI